MLDIMKCCLGVGLALLAGCNQPAVAPKLPAFQSSENTVRDWNDVAHKIALQMAQRGLLPFGVNGQARPMNSAPTPPVFVRNQAPGSAFIQHVGHELESEILVLGGTVARTPEGATVVNLDVDFVKWGPRDKPPGLAGALGGVASIPGIVIGASLPMSTWTAANAAGLSAVGLGMFADTIVALTPTMNAEAIWQATIVTNDRVLMRLQEPVYVRAPDLALYVKAGTLSPAASWSDNAPLRARLIRYSP
jgi:hypothetical protein